jgi:hypothetical protein
MYAWQGATPQAALEEIASTTQPEVIARHLPEPVQKRIEALPAAKKQAILKSLLELKSSQLQDCTVRPAHEGSGWEIIDEDGDLKGKVTLDNAFISGLEAMLPLRFETPGGDSQSFIVTMHLEDDEWRIDDFGPWTKTDLGLAKLLHEPTEMEDNEAAARKTLTTIYRALMNYATVHPAVGYPSGLRALIAPLVLRHHGVTVEMSMLDESFTADPLIRNGYRFRYQQTGTGNGTTDDVGSFELTAVPVEFGKTGGKSFFINENGRLRTTTENRPATAQDRADE